ncbi:hypothetical protein MYX76_18200, partial [Desulfobacterota bacterium AH_259_B03_O07]|nr:hypothetical protein [Desulfobacterota bacterium AH_259_B03_O07]
MSLFENGGSQWTFDYNITDNQLEFNETGAAAHLVIEDATGNVGIGTTSPSSLLSVQGNALISGTTTVQGLIATSSIMIGAGDSFAKLTIKSPLEGTPFSLSPLVGHDGIYIEDLTEADAAGSIGGSISFSGPVRADRRYAAIAAVREAGDADFIGLAFYTHDNTNSTIDMRESFRIANDGNIGIGSTTPTGLLSLENTGSSPTVYISDELNDTSPFVIDASGNVGIGTVSPGAPLQVTGNVWISNSGTLAVDAIQNFGNSTTLTLDS